MTKGSLREMPSLLTDSSFPIVAAGFEHWPTSRHAKRRRMCEARDRVQAPGSKRSAVFPASARQEIDCELRRAHRPASAKATAVRRSFSEGGSASREGGRPDERLARETPFLRTDT
jgi:hypothetical protein